MKTLSVVKGATISLGCLFATLVFSADVEGFRHSTSNAASSSAYIIGAVSAKVEDGQIQFKNDRYDAVIAYIHDKNGNIVDKVIIPGAVDSYFTAAASAIKDTLPALASGQGLKPLRDYFEKGSAITLDSGVPVSGFPEGGAISYVSGTPDAILATVASGMIKTFTTVISAGSSQAVPDSILGKISKAVLEKAISDPELLVKASMLLASDKPGELGKVVLDWLSEKGRNAAMASLLEQGFPVDSKRLTELLDTAIKPLETVSNSLVAASSFRDAWLESEAGPKVLWYDMPYDSNEVLSDQSRFNWIGTPLARHDEVFFSSALNDKDNSGTFWNPSTWNDKFEAEYDRYRSIPLDMRASGSWATVSMQNQLSAITNGGASHIGSASLFSGYNNEQPNANVNPNNTNNYQTQTGSQQTAYSTNSQAFQSSDWVLVAGNAATHIAVGNSFGTITAPDGGQIASLNNAGVQYTLITKSFYVPIGTKQATLSFNGNFVTNEYPVFVGSQYNDFASVKITSPSGNVTPVTAFDQSLNASNFALVNGLPSPLGSTGGQTGFKASTATINVAGGGTVTVVVKVANVGDTAVPSAILLNKITVK